jgi:hypothetical protein
VGRPGDARRHLAAAALRRAHSRFCSGLTAQPLALPPA